MATPPRAAKHPIVDNRYFSDPGHLIAPGETVELRIRLCFGEPDATIESLAPRVYADYAKTRPMSLRWPDRRPIGTLFYAHPYKQWPTNPRGFNFGKGEKNDILSEAGRVQFEAALMTCASQCVANLKAMDAQGVIIWDLEGEEKPHAISYVGDPRMLPAVAPELDRVADAFMKTFSDAGLKIGITLRPTEYYERMPGKRDWSHREVADPVALLSEKIQYAQKRWGCTIFYVDSNVFGKDWVDLPKEANVPWLMPVGMLEALHAKHPDCLIIPEWSGADYHRYSAPYASCNLGQLGTWPVNRKIWPEAFTVVAVSKGLLESKWETYLTNVQGGDVLLFPCWYSPAENTLVQLLYREAAYRREAVASAVSKVALPEELSRATTPEEAVRYQAAVRLGDFTTPETLRQTAAALDDVSLLVRKAALGSIARQGAVSEPAVIDTLVGLLQSKAPDAAVLRAFVGTALGRLGEPAVTPLIALAGQKGPAQSQAVQALGVTGTRNPQAIVTLLPLVQDPKDAALRELAVVALGALHAKDAVPALLALLDEPKNSETLRKEAVIALGRIGDARAVEALVREHARPYSSMVIYSIHRTLDEALWALTGQTTLIGRDEWKQWWAAQPRSLTP
jgi:HEAT repeat protein